MNTAPLDGKAALVCGASRGLGRASALALAARGARVVLLARDPARLEAARRDLPGGGHRVLAADLGDLDALRDAVTTLLDDVSPIQILVNNSGGPAAGRLGDVGPEAFPAAFTEHVGAAHLLAGLLLPGMRAAEWGRIVNILSTTVKQPLPGLGVSNTVRGAMASWSKTLSGEVARFGVTVNNVLPGPTRTERLDELIHAWAKRDGKTPEAVEAGLLASIPAGRFGEPEDLAAAVAFLASPEAGYVNGVSIAVDGGRTTAL